MSVAISRADRDLISRLYESTSLTVDDLPYTPEFEQLFNEFCDRSPTELDRHQFWLKLTGIRKAGQLIRKQR